MNQNATYFPTFEQFVNWEWVHAHHPKEHGKVIPGPWCRTIITHARRNGYKGRINESFACRIINSNLY